MHNKNHQLPIICLMGPTACGKTDLAIALAKQWPFEIINVDSAQIYREMDVGSGKPSVAIRQTVPHHLMDFLDPSVPYSAAQFRQDTLSLIQAIKSRGQIPLLVGGTMLYFKILQDGMSPLPQANIRVRAKIEEKALAKGWQALHEELAQLDPVIGAKIKSTDTQRIQRALEVIMISGQPMSELFSQPKALTPYQFVNMGLLPLKTPRSILHERIAARFDGMLQQGLVNEVKTLMQRKDLNLALPSLRAVGYRQVWQFLAHEIDYAQMQERAIASTRQLAKRQLTWLRSWPNLTQFDFLDPQLFVKVTEFLRSVLNI